MDAAGKRAWEPQMGKENDLKKKKARAEPESAKGEMDKTARAFESLGYGRRLAAIM